MNDLKEATGNTPEQKLIGEVSQEQIDKWKSTAGVQGVSGIIVGGHICYVKKPDRTVVSYALSQMSFVMIQGDSPNDPGKLEMSMGKLQKQGEAVLNNCWLGGSEKIKTDTSLWTGACLKAGELIEYKEATLKNF